MSQRTLGKPELGVLYLGWFLVDADLVVINPLLVPLAGHFQTSLVTVTFALTGYLLLFGILQPIYGVVSDAVGRVRVMRIGLLGIGGANLVAALASHVGLLIAGRALAGAAAAALVPVTVAYVGDRVEPQHRQRVLAGLLSVSALGFASGTLASGVLAELVSWRASLLVIAVTALTLAVFYARLPEARQPDAARVSPLSRVGEVFSRGPMVFLLAFSVVEGAAMMGFFNFFNAALQLGGSGIVVAVLVTGTYGVGAVAGGRLVRLVHERLSQAALFGIGTSLLAIGYLTAALSQSVAAILVASVCCGASLAIAQSTLQVWTIQAAPSTSLGTAISFGASAVFIGAAISTAAVGGLAAAGDFGLLFGIAAVVTVPVIVVGTLAQARFSRVANQT
ncbi:MAG: MFS transporter [Stackebrandtia sp.]